MEHHFSVEVAATHGVNVAIFLNNIAYWIHKNKANKKHLHDGRYWTYNSQESFQELFPYWTRQNLRTIIDYCTNNDLILKANYNENKYDRTTWYALTDKALELYHWLKTPMDTITSSIGGNQP